MGFRLISLKKMRKAKSGNAEEVLQRLKSFLDGNFEEPVRILNGFWKDQQDAISYQELREAVKAGVLDKDIYQTWSMDYSVLVKEHLKPLWENAVYAGALGQSMMSGLPDNFSMQTSGVMKWIEKRGAEFVTNVSEEQKQAVQALLVKKVVERHTVDELAKFIRPCIGLTEGQAKANLRYYDNIVATLKKEHPRMKPESIEKKARDAAVKYAERQHRQRAMMIAQTESAFAYNWGAHEEILQAQSQGIMGKMVKRWCTSGDDQVCSICQAFEGMEIEMDKGFPFKGKKLFAGQDLLPPAHPRCACAVEYIEVEPPAITDIPRMQVDITQADSFREYTTEEIERMAVQTEEVISKHIATPSKWSGNVIVDDKRGKTGKLWNCDILATHMTSPHMILHEQIHACSISYYKEEIYFQYENIEEASVQFMAQEISMMEGIESIDSSYDKMVDALRQIGKRMGICKTDYDFAKLMIEMPVPERLDWISENLYAILGKDISVTVEEYQKYSDLLDMLYV